MLQAVIFDFDGLILETETPEVRSWEQVFAAYGATYPEAYWRFALGRGAEQVRERPYEILIRQIQPPFPSEEDVLHARGRILSEMLAALQVMPGVVDRLLEADDLGLRIGIASSSRHAWVDRHLERLGLLNCFQEIVCADDVPRAKPFPDLYVECCRRLGALPDRSVAFEDSVNGCLSAHEAGLLVIAVPTALSLGSPFAARMTVSSLEHVRLSDLSV